MGTFKEELCMGKCRYHGRSSRWESTDEFDSEISFRLASRRFLFDALSTTSGTFIDLANSGFYDGMVSTT
jgi:hypothetical protein